MKTITATKSQRYADKKPSDPQHVLVIGVVYDLPDHIADRVIELGGGELFTEAEPVNEIIADKVEEVTPDINAENETADDFDNSETKPAVEVETKENPKKRGRPPKKGK